MSHPYKSQARDNNPKWMKRLADGGTVTRGSQGVVEHVQDALRDRGLPGSLDPEELDARPVGWAAVGRTMAGGETRPNARVSQGFKAIKERTVPGKDQ